MRLYYKDKEDERVFGADDVEGEIFLKFLKFEAPDVLLELVKICESRKWGKKVYLELQKKEHEVQEITL